MTSGTGKLMRLAATEEENECGEQADRQDDAANGDEVQPVGDDDVEGKHHRYDGEILRDQDTDGNLTGAGAEFADFLQHLDRHRRARQGDDEPKQQRCRQRPVHNPAD